MRLFHVGEDPNIKVFQPRLPNRKDLDPTVGLVWAIDEHRLPNFLTPRNCPRVAYHINNTMYLYEFDSADFELQDSIAGYYVSGASRLPIAKHTVSDLFTEPLHRNVEIRITDNLWDIADAVKQSSLNWSLCRMAYAKPRP